MLEKLEKPFTVPGFLSKHSVLKQIVVAHRRVKKLPGCLNSRRNKTTICVKSILEIYFQKKKMECIQLLRHYIMRTDLVRNALQLNGIYKFTDELVKI